MRATRLYIVCAAFAAYGPGCDDKKSETKEETKSAREDASNKFLDAVIDNWPTDGSDSTDAWAKILPHAKKVLGGERTFKNWRLEVDNKNETLEGINYSLAFVHPDNSTGLQKHVVDIDIAKKDPLWETANKLHVTYLCVDGELLPPPEGLEDDWIAHTLWTDERKAVFQAKATALRECK